MRDEEQKPQESDEARAFRFRCEAGARLWHFLVSRGPDYRPPPRTAEEQQIIDLMEKELGRKLTVAEEDWNIEQARSVM